MKTKLPTRVPVIDTIIFYDEPLMELIGNPEQLYLANKLSDDRWLVTAPNIMDLKDSISGIIGTRDLFINSKEGVAFYAKKRADSFDFIEKVDSKNLKNKELPLRSAKFPRPSDWLISFVSEIASKYEADNIESDNRDALYFSLLEQGTEISANTLATVLTDFQRLANSISEKILNTKINLKVFSLRPGSVRIQMKQEDLNDILGDSNLYRTSETLVEVIDALKQEDFNLLSDVADKDMITSLKTFFDHLSKKKYGVELRVNATAKKQIKTTVTSMNVDLFHKVLSKHEVKSKTYKYYGELQAIDHTRRTFKFKHDENIIAGKISGLLSGVVFEVPQKYEITVVEEVLENVITQEEFKRNYYLSSVKLAPESTDVIENTR